MRIVHFAHFRKVLNHCLIPLLKFHLGHSPPPPKERKGDMQFHNAVCAELKNIWLQHRGLLCRLTPSPTLFYEVYDLKWVKGKDWWLTSPAAPHPSFPIDWISCTETAPAQELVGCWHTNFHACRQWKEGPLLLKQTQFHKYSCNWEVLTKAARISSP